MAMVFQNYALYPHMTVWDNIAFGLETQKLPPDEIKQRIKLALQMLNLSGMEERKPKELSGGQRQRVALARAVVKQAPYFLLDEPLSNLDAQLRSRARKELVKLHEVIGSTMVYVTHDQVEAMTIGQRIVVLSQGVLQQVGSPTEIYDWPANIFVARFIGSPPMNLVSAQVEGKNLRVGEALLCLPPEWMERLTGYKGRKVEMGMRPEHVRLSEQAMNVDGTKLEVQATFREHFGNQSIVYFQCGGKELAAVVAPGLTLTEDGKLVWQIDWEQVRMFDSETGLAIRLRSE